MYIYFFIIFFVGYNLNTLLANTFLKLLEKFNTMLGIHIEMEYKDNYYYLYYVFINLIK